MFLNLFARRILRICALPLLEVGLQRRYLLVDVRNVLLDDEGELLNEITTYVRRRMV